MKLKLIITLIIFMSLIMGFVIDKFFTKSKKY